MSKQTQPIRKQCQSRQQCERDAIWGVYNWQHGQTDVNLDRPVRVFCGAHKPRFDIRTGEYSRNVRIRRDAFNGSESHT